ncbi:MAG TPA: hypothetical protein VKZ79_02140 [Alphaproteobacteria bacterium]|nr:hypothetical protein [Alphaproteobacteria bacterium]
MSNIASIFERWRAARFDWPPHVTDDEGRCRWGKIAELERSAANTPALSIADILYKARVALDQAEDGSEGDAWMIHSIVADLERAVAGGLQ